MKRIGTTSTGTVIVEMSAAQFDGLSQLQGASPLVPVATAMSISDRATYARGRIAKLRPKKKDGLTRSITAMFQHTGGISEADIQEVIARLQKGKSLAIDENGRVTYNSG